jgi:DNA-binding transcriptional regulator LsrR (DeoR family)
MYQPTPTHHPDSLESRVLWLHEVGGLPPREIAWRLGVPEPRVARILGARLGPADPVRAFVSEPAWDLAGALVERFGLASALVASPHSPAESPMETVAQAGAAFLADEIRRSSSARLIALSHGRTIAGAAAAIPRIRAAHIRFVSLLGDLTARRAAYPHEVMYTLARRLGAEAYIMPAPLYIPTRAEKEALERISFIAEIQRLQAAADTVILGIGQADPESQLLSMGMVEREALEMLMEAGAMGEIMGRFVDAQGRELPSALAARTISPPIETLRGRRVVAMAGGLSKVPAIRAVLKSGILRELVTDRLTAEALLD